MKLDSLAHTSQRRLIEMLRVIGDADKPIGARAISDILCERGYEIGERAVRYNLKILDELGFTRKYGYSGRTLTFLGERELKDALVNERIGFVNTRIEEYIYRTDLDLELEGGDVIVNTSIVDKSLYEFAADVLLETFQAGYTISRRVILVDEGSEIASIEIPAGCLGIGTVCSITLDGILMKRGIPVNTSFAGVVEIDEGRATSFSDLIAYAGSSLDPIKIFMARRMSRVGECISLGSGRILANVREIPSSALDLAEVVLSQVREIGIDGMITIGRPGEPILGCPVSAGKVGIALCAGVNGPLAIEEAGIEVSTLPISGLVDYGLMRELQ